VFYGFQARINNRYWDYPDAVLYARRERSNLREDPLVGRACHDLMWIPLGSTIWPNHDNARPQILQEVPPCPGDSEKILIVIDIAKNF